ncbi:hypothetical protein [Porphyromonas uenonis]|uniref:hypothetical protein n=1 Tax=Porphyromonas uenonis TaxID=281920 RepID=UPI00046EA7DB|nr:hypothetical protein [Porphyromonas uenonis]
MEVKTPPPPPHYVNRIPEQPAKPVTNVYVQNVVQSPQKNSLGTAGFALSLVALVVGWFPVVGWIVWVLGAIFSTIGIFRKPRGLAIAGACISFFWLIIFVLIFGVFMTAVVAHGYANP